MEFKQVTTKGGDRGESSLYNGERRPKDDPIFHFLGNLDELNSALGVAKAGLAFYIPHKKPEEWCSFIDFIQRQLILLGGMAANPGGGKAHFNPLTEEAVDTLEEYQMKLMKLVTLPQGFILPGKTLYGGWLDMARSICRRCERSLIPLLRENQELGVGQIFLNRLSDFLYISCRYWEDP